MTPLVAAFSKTAALTSRKYVSEQGMGIRDLLKKLRLFKSLLF